MKAPWIAIIAAFSFSPHVLAQNKQIPSDSTADGGYWELFEVGATMMLPNRGFGEDARRLNLGLSLLIGGTVSNRLRLGGEIFGFSGSHSGGNFHAVAIYTPVADQRLFVRGGAGMGYGNGLSVGLGSSAGVGVNAGRLFGSDLTVSIIWYRHASSRATRNVLVLSIGDYEG